jgi:MATE family multidrug resistance protein
MIITVGHGAFRGYQDTRTPLYVTLGLNAVNLVLDPIFIFGLGAGLVGAAWATVVAQWVGAAAFLALLWAGRSRLGIAAGRPGWGEVRMLLGAGRPLVIRTLALLGTLTLATAVAARVGTVAVAAYQVLAQLWLFLALVVDALAIAAQAMIGKSVGAGSVDARAIANRLLVLGLGLGLALAAVMALAAPWLSQLFTDDPAVVAAIRSAYGFVVVMQPLNAIVFVWDGIVIGATDFGYLAVSMVIAAVTSSAVLLAVVPQGWGLAGVWWGLVVLMATRALTLLAWQLRGPLSAVPDRSPSSPGG